MNFQDIGVLVELIFLILIWLDGRTMKQHSAETVVLQRQSVEHQRQYLDLRKKWYESRTKKKENASEIKVPSEPGTDKNIISGD